MIIFVGDKPSKKNIDPSTPFVGTQSYKRLLDWIWKMNLDITDVAITNISQAEFSNLGAEVKTHWGHISYEAVVALGQKASNKLKKLGIPHFHLPHPSGLNRLNNDNKYIEKQLKLCKTYLKVK